jgi:DNA primase
MKEERLIGLLEKVLGKSDNARGGDEAVFKCPNCKHHKKKLTLNKYTQAFQCWVCNFKGRRAIQILKKAQAPSQFFTELRDIDSQYKFTHTEIDSQDKPEVVLPDNFIPLIQGKGLTRNKAWHYLQSRGITAQDVVKYNIGYIEEGPLANFIIIPSYDRQGLLNYWVGRSFNPKSYFKHKLPSVSKDIIGFDMMVNFNLPLIICEGAFDAIAIKRNAVPLFGKKISKSLYKELIQGKVKQIYLALDQDAINDSLKYAKELMSYGKEIFLLELQDKDPSEIGFEEMTHILQNAKPLTFSSFIEKKILYQ